MPFLLPPEIFEAIFLFTSPAALASLTRTSAFTGSIATRLLYRELYISHSPLHVPPTVVLTLAKRPDVARHVRCFAVVLDHSSTLFHAFYRRLAAALSSMSALVSLDIFIDEGSWVLPENLVYPQLHHFASSFSFDARVVNFLGNAPALEGAQIASAAAPAPSIPHACIRRLAEFSGCSSAAAAVVPGRPVESIHINSGDLTEDLLPALSQSTAVVAVLSITTSSAPVPLLQALGQHLPHIVYLRITSTCNLPAPPTNIFYEQVAAALAFFPHLQSFELSGMYWSSSKKPDDQQRVWQSHPFNNGSRVQDETETVDIYSNTADFFFS
ncbi:hypothetical protein C8R43DRAFT_1077771 [Mycena crocata]|nr:hypothetical protein C8R43DRAFT_1077771 [Mycena crocata]